MKRTYKDIKQKTYRVLFELDPDGGTSSELRLLLQVDGKPIIFPIVPNLSLSWTTCEAQNEPGNSTLYRCELKPGYVFR